MAKKAGAKAKAKQGKNAKPAKKSAPKKATSASKKSAPKKPIERAKAASTGGSLPIVDRIAADLPRLTDTQRSAFLGQFSDAQCDEAGVRTKSALVYSEAVGWASAIDRSLRDYALVLRRYTRLRFAWYLECVRSLASAIEAQRTAEGRTGAAIRSVDKARDAGLTARDELRETLGILAGGDKDKQSELAAAEGSSASNTELAGQLRALAAIAKTWLQRFDPESHALVESVSLTQHDVETALDCASELTQTAETRALAPRRAVRDAPAVNRAEGRVLMEMKLVMRVFESANEKTKLVPKLVPGVGTRGLLAPHSKGKVSQAPAASPQQPPAAPQTPPPEGS